MKKSSLILLLLLFVLQGAGQQLEDKLKHLTKNYPITYEKLKADSLFSEKYLIKIVQPVDHQNPGGSKFEQRVFVSHIDFDSPVVFITEGYAAGYAARAAHVNELAVLLNANQVCVEHRYFGTSVPDSIYWEYLTVENAATDHHKVIGLLKNIYDNKWVSTGISKGGQTAMYHRYFYPDDVDISVPYVAPLNFSIEDKRVYTFLESVSSKECRQMIYHFQKELLQNKDVYLPVFEKLAKKKGLNYRMGMEKAFELTVLEYSFAFFQWGVWTCDSIPNTGLKNAEMIKHLDQVAGLRWISNEGISELQPFFYQAMREIGFYGYEIEPFEEWVSFTENPTFEFTLPEGVNVEYEPKLMQDVDQFIRHNAENMLFIYGEYDPWSATTVDLTLNTNSIKIVKPAGSHRTRINNLPADQKKLVINTLKTWLKDQD